MFDLTKEITLNSEKYTNYRRLQIAVYILAILIALFLAYLVIFPTQYFQFSFPNPNSTQNNITGVHNSELAFPDRGRFDSAGNIFFYSSLEGNYSQANVSFTLDKDSEGFENGTLEARKSYQAFLYPEGSPIGFKDGTLFKNNNNYYIVSAGKIRKFSSLNLVDSLGFKKEAFVEEDGFDFKFSNQGDDISGISSYPDSSIFKIKDDYYILQDQKLKKFISPAAFATQYNANQAIEKDNSFLAKYPLDENILGFRDSTLISYGISVFIVSSGRILPVNNTVTFSSMGYDWNDVIPAGGDEVSLYEKDKLFTISSPHPDGTIMKDEKENKWYVIENGEKHLLPSENIANSWLPKGNPISISEESLSLKNNCSLGKNTFSSRTYSCDIPLDNFKPVIGKDYEFKLSSDNDIKLETINADFQKTASWQNFKDTVSSLLTRVKANYVQ
ncbi:MAG: hypothetical protein WCV59_00720 [Parcubacteria group bacterium]|jgi:hypothetical protein